MRPQGSAGGEPQAAGCRRDDGACRRIISAPDLYGTLGVARDADEAAIKSEFRRRAREVHPDKNASPLAAEAFRRLQAASEVLADPKARRRYDVFGEDEPPQPQQHSRPPDMDEALNFSFLRLVMAGPLLSILVMAMGSGVLQSVLQGERAHRQQWAGNFGRGDGQSSEKPQPPPEEAAVRLTSANAEATCGAPGSRMCVVLLVKPKEALSDRESKLVRQLKAETAERVRTSTGQHLALTWARAAAAGRWRELLPPGASLPWVVVLKPSAAGLRFVSVPVPDSGGREQGRLSKGVPKLLQEIASGSARFTPLKGSLASLF